VLDEDREIPAWFDSVPRKAVQPDTLKRYTELSEFVFDLRNPNKVLLNQPPMPLIERNPVHFWKRFR